MSKKMEKNAMFVFFFFFLVCLCHFWGVEYAISSEQRFLFLCNVISSAGLITWTVKCLGTMMQIADSERKWKRMHIRSWLSLKERK